VQEAVVWSAALAEKDTPPARLQHEGEILAAHGCLGRITAWFAEHASPTSANAASRSVLMVDG
jgi:hypothetical protein